MPATGNGNAPGSGAAAAGQVPGEGDRLLEAVDVAVLAPIRGREVLVYAVPSALSGRLREGMRVIVPLGGRQLTGIVLGASTELPEVALRDVLDVLDEEPFLTPDLLALCRFASTYYMATLGEVLSTAVLAGLRAQSRRRVRRAPSEDSPPDARLGRTEREILRRLPPDRAVGVLALQRSIGLASFYQALRSLAARKLVTVEEEPPRAEARVRQLRVLHPAREPTATESAELERRAPARWRLLQAIRTAGFDGLPSKALGGGASNALRSLFSAGLVREERRETYRTVVDRAPGPWSAPPVLTAAQAAAVEAIEAARTAPRFEVFLLRGVTGSGKTEVYLRVAEATLASGRGVLFLVPEIALTHDLVSRVCARFGSTVALLHSALSPGERWDEWRRLARRNARVAVGVRSAVFAPLPDLGLVVVDEEHDGAYKQDDALRYNARDLAIVRARNAGCPVVLGSATPSIESHHHATTGRYRSLELRERVERRPMPAVDRIDLRTERPEGDPAVFAPRLRAALADNLAAGGQSLVFLNRRGFARYLQCRVCGHVLGCPNCSVTLTFHLRGRVLRCHHCDHRRQAPELCPECTSPSIGDFGVGTEQVEEALRALLPAARVARMDRDTMAGKGAHQRLLDAWRAREIDLLVGTQMVTKGHDVPGVTLVAVVNADDALNFPDFRAAERTFQLLTQVAGRSGRGDQPGRVFVQTYRPTHYAIAFAVDHEYAGFAERELRYRESLGYPPFARLVNVRFDGGDAARVEATAREVAGNLRAASARQPRRRQATVLGPAPAPLERLRGRWRWQILLKGREPAALRAVLASSIDTAMARARSGGVRMVVDVDPQGML